MEIDEKRLHEVCPAAAQDFRVHWSTEGPRYLVSPVDLRGIHACLLELAKELEIQHVAATTNKGLAISRRKQRDAALAEVEQLKAEWPHQVPCPHCGRYQVYGPDTNTLSKLKAEVERLRSVMVEVADNLAHDCTCGPAYKDRGMTAPDCIGCWIADDVKRLKAELEARAMPERIYTQRVSRCRSCPKFGGGNWFDDLDAPRNALYGILRFGAGCFVVNRHMSYEQAELEPPDWCPLSVVEADDA